MAKLRGPSKLARGPKGGKGLERGPRKSPKPPPPAPAVKIERAVPAVCSECFGDFDVSTAPKKDKIICPACGHVGLYDAQLFAEIAVRRQAHRKNFIVALVVNALGLAFLIAWALANSHLCAGTGGADSTTNMATMGLGAVLLIAGFILVFKYEKSRVEVYF
ncbi:MAG TPA: hypothetical protein PKX48_10265 [Planctomycetota bacterium]|jgi:hypothetical protein|nr:hypothetical protein [Planctomycetota bacterium]OQC21694.1 MAG: hypothetical protein BWX69_00624 [Planctomycetes bacterium ADurb.Bin069]NMD35236.1 hypothetical protein [Planctomycetota bacterium]HNR98926.1 hypothetical protein [Planctomycetota bacterium]HNU25999.1 hypothetical protein [Planctomycetota bacterium]